METGIRKSNLIDLKHEKLQEIPVSEDIVLNDCYSIALPLNDKQTVNLSKNMYMESMDRDENVDTKNNTVEVPKEILLDDMPIRSSTVSYNGCFPGSQFGLGDWSLIGSS
jgi:hypothetical protein